MNMIICCVNWEAVGAISNIVMAFIALASLGFSIYLLFRERKNRIEDIRARLNFSVTYWKENYYLQIHNVGKEVAYNVNVCVGGKAIEENPYEHVKYAFSLLREKNLVLSPGDKLHYLISPGITRNKEMGIGDDTHSSAEINSWLKTHDEDKIIITGKYNNKYVINESFSIRDFYPIGTFHVIEPLVEIAESLSSFDPKDKSIQKNIQKIANEIKINTHG
jgi:hypothetical protein